MKIVPQLADEGRCIASESTMYRILRAEEQLNHRSRSKPPSARLRPKALTATGPNQVWCWDITYLKSSIGGQFFYAYVVMDLYSRKIVGHAVFDAECQEADGVAWARNSDATIPEHWWSTQRRHLRLAARLVGVARNLDDRIRESIAGVLSASGLWQREHSGATGYRALGAAVCGILKRLRGGHSARAFALLVCGHLAGLWGEPMRWDSCRQDLVRSPFCCRGTMADT